MAHSHSWQVAAGCWQETSVPLPLGAYAGLLVCLHDRVAGLPQSQQSKTARQKQQCHLWSHLGSHALSVLQCSTNHQFCLIQCGTYSEGTARRHKYQKARIIGGHLEGWLPEFLSFIFHSTMCSFHSPSKKESQIESLLFVSSASSLVQDTVHTRLHCNILPSDLPLSALVTLMHFSHSSHSFIFSVNSFNVFIVLLLQTRFVLGSQNITVDKTKPLELMYSWEISKRIIWKILGGNMCNTED